jgi:hypothetical protein
MSDRARYWSELLRAWERSGLSQAEFCRRRGLKAVSFSWWKRQLGMARRPTHRGARSQTGGSRPGPRAKFVEVTWPTAPSVLSSALDASTGSFGYEVVLTSGRVLRLPLAFAADQVSRLITAVESC